ncbi:MAG TPA: Holliday junction branch migration DNA helicase RuvB [Chloroflexota bacterium]|nr:Holliday junction branch migration DNA helicase RuvB [Chloroflexota bacterium]
MGRKATVRAKAVKDDESSEEQDAPIVNLRPQTLEEYGRAGQRAVVENLGIAIQAARQRGEPLEHVLLYGPPGLGKTTLAHVLSHEMRATLISSSGPALERQSDLMGILTNLETGSVLFVDEIHRLPRTVEEFMYSAMEDFTVDFVLEKGTHARTIKFPLKRFTLVGATTRSGMLTAPLRDRFGFHYHLDFYSPEDLTTVVLRSAAILETHVDEDAAVAIARRSRGTPRIANRLLRRVRDFAQVRADGRITLDVSDEALAREGVDELGLNDMDRRYLQTIRDFYQGGPVGIEALAATLNEEKDTLVDVIEPFLLKLGLVTRTPGGRKLGSTYNDDTGRANQQSLFG